MRLIYILTLFSFFGFSQTNEVLINQALQTAESQNITTQAQAVQALAASGMTETQARQLAAQRGISYDQLLNDFFSDEINIESIADPDTSILEEASISDVNEVIEEIDNINRNRLDSLAELTNSVLKQRQRTKSEAVKDISSSAISEFVQ